MNPPPESATTPPLESWLLSLRSTTISANDREIFAKDLQPYATDPRVLPTLLEYLEDPNRHVRIAAITALAKAATDDRILPKLLTCWQNQDWMVRYHLLKAIVPHATDPRVLLTLLDFLKDEERMIRRAAIKAFTPDVIAAHANDEWILPALLERWQDNEGVLTAIAPDDALPTLLEFLKETEDLEGRLQALKGIYSVAEAKALQPYATDPRVLPTLLAYLEHPKGSFRRAAVIALTPYANDDRILPKLLTCWQDEVGMKSVASYVLRAITPHATDARILPTLLEFFQSEDADYREYAVKAFTPEVIEAHANDERIFPALLARCKDEDPRVQRAAITAIAPYATHPKVLPTLLAFLKDEDWWVRKTAIETLAPHGNHEEILSALRECLKDEHYRVREAAIEALTPYAKQNRQVFCALRECLQDQDGVIRELAIKAVGADALAENSADAPWVLPTMLKYLGDEYSSIRQAVMEAFTADVLATHMPQALPALVAYLKYERRIKAIELLTPYATDPRVLPALVELLKDRNQDTDCRLKVIEAFMDNTDNDQVLAALLAPLTEFSSTVPEAAVKALAQRETSTPEMLSALLKRHDACYPSEKTSIKIVLKLHEDDLKMLFEQLDAEENRTQDQENIHQYAAQTLVDISHLPKAYQRLAELFYSSDSDVAQSAARYLTHASDQVLTLQMLSGQNTNDLLELERHIWQEWTAPEQDEVSIKAKQFFLIKTLPIDVTTSAAINTLWFHNETATVQQYLLVTKQFNQNNSEKSYRDWTPLKPLSNQWFSYDYSIDYNLIPPNDPLKPLYRVPEELRDRERSIWRSKQFLLGTMAPYVHDHSSDINSQLFQKER
jgi:HEAT repeat protein